MKYFVVEELLKWENLCSVSQASLKTKNRPIDPNNWFDLILSRRPYYVMSIHFNALCLIMQNNTDDSKAKKENAISPMFKL